MAGDSHARERLVERVLPPLERWARGRLPQWARSLADTQDLVQDVVLRALPRLTSFEAQGPGALRAYLQRGVNNEVVDEIRKAKRRPVADDALDEQVDLSPSPLEQAIRREGLEKYNAALATLKPAEQEIIRARIDRQQSYEEIAAALGKPNPNAARMAVSRAIARLLSAMAGKKPA